MKGMTIKKKKATSKKEKNTWGVAVTGMVHFITNPWLVRP